MSRRIVSLVPAATELIAALGLRRQLVARSHRCDAPASILHLPALTAEGVPPPRDPAAPLRPTQLLVAQQLAPAPVDVEALVELQPDFIVTHPRTDAPGFQLEELKRAVNSLMVSRPQLVFFNPEQLPAVYNEFQKVADTFGAGQQGKALVGRIRRRAEQIAERARNSAARPRVLVLGQLQPLATTGWWVPTLIETAGGAPLLARPGAAPPHITWSAVAEADPDVIMLALSPGQLTVEAQLRQLMALDDFRGLRAYRSRRVVVLSHELLHRPGPRVIDALEVIAEVLHPRQFGIRRLGLLWGELF